MFLSEWREFPLAPCLAGKNLMTAHVSVLLKSHTSLTCFRACLLPGQAKDFSAPWYYLHPVCVSFLLTIFLKEDLLRYKEGNILIVPSIIQAIEIIVPQVHKLSMLYPLL